MTDNDKLKNFFNLLVVENRKIILPYFRKKIEVETKKDLSPVTIADKLSEQKIRALIVENFPEHGIQGEEFPNENLDSEYQWIIDPIDGTSNFLHGIPHFAISLALENKKEIICGIVFDPIKNEIFSAEKGNGAYLNNQRMRVSARKKLKDCLIVTGGPRQNHQNKEVCMEEYKKFSSKVLIPIRKMGSASLDMAYVAAGRCDGFWQRNLNYWDIAAGVLLVKEAGGYVTDFSGKDKYIENKTILATNSRIGEEMIAVLK